MPVVAVLLLQHCLAAAASALVAVVMVVGLQLPHVVVRTSERIPAAWTLGTSSLHACVCMRARMHLCKLYVSFVLSVCDGESWRGVMYVKSWRGAYVYVCMASPGVVCIYTYVWRGVA